MPYPIRDDAESDIGVDLAMRLIKNPKRDLFAEHIQVCGGVRSQIHMHRRNEKFDVWLHAYYGKPVAWKCHKCGKFMWAHIDGQPATKEESENASGEFARHDQHNE